MENALKEMKTMHIVIKNVQKQSYLGLWSSYSLFLVK